MPARMHALPNRRLLYFPFHCARYFRQLALGQIRPSPKLQVKFSSVSLPSRPLRSTLSDRVLAIISPRLNANGALADLLFRAVLTFTKVA